jgi:predicted membrane-bound dolichyl-phosphate-mannose-protein mannosyltransferase
MINKILLISFILCSTSIFAQENISKNLEILFFENEKRVENEVYAVNDSTNLFFKLAKVNNLINIDKDLRKCTLFIKSENHIVKIPKIDYLFDVDFIEVNFYDFENKQLFEKKYNKEFKRKGKSYQVNFGLEDIYFLNYSTKQIKQLNKNFRNLNF